MTAPKPLSWSMGTHRAAVWTGSPPLRPWLTLLLCETTQKIIDVQLTPELPTAADKLKWLDLARRRPEYRVNPPQKLRVLSQADYDDLHGHARQHKIACTTGPASTLRAHVLADLARDFERQQWGAERPSLIEALGPELTVAVFRAGAHFFEQKLWKRLGDYQLGEQREPERYFLALGAAGVEYGLLVYRSRDAAVATMHNQAPQSDVEPTAALLFVSEQDMTFPDIDFFESTGLPRPQGERWPKLMRGTSEGLPSRGETAVLLSILQAPEWSHSEVAPPSAEDAVTEWIANWPKKTATARKIALTLLEWMFAQKVNEKTSVHCWMIGYLWCQEVSRFSVRKLLELGPLEEKLGTTFQLSAADLKSYRATWKKLEKHLSGLA